MLTNAELIELEELLEQQKISERINLLINPDGTINKNYRALHKAINEQEWGFDENHKPILKKGYAGFVLEGSSRSGKTWSGVDIIIYLATVKHKEKGCTINIYRETYNEFKTTLYDDFKRRLDDFGLPNKFKESQEVKSFKIGKTRIHFLGDGKHGGGCDYAFLNEAMMIKNEIFDQVKIRCRKFWWMDYNPSFTMHWIFDKVLKRPDVGFLRTTFRDNAHIKPNELNEILGYEPWEPGSYEVNDHGDIIYNGKLVDEKNQPPPHLENIKNGTADEFMWVVYGLGLKGAMEGRIFKNVTWIDKFPEHLAFTYGTDFGFSAAPSVAAKYGREGRNIYLEPLFYHPTPTPDDLHNSFKAAGMSYALPNTADSSDKHVKDGESFKMVEELDERGWEISKVVKSKTVMYWLQKMKTFKIHIVRNHLYEAAKAEVENYVYKNVNGIMINQPEDKFNHFWDSCFVGDTLINTMEGLKPIKHVNIGDMVLTSEGYNKVLNRWENGVKKVYSFRMHFDTFCLNLCCTSDHKVKTENGWTQISKLKPGTTVFLSNFSMEKSISSTREKFISVADQEKCTGMYGNFTTENETKVFTYTTKTETLKTTIRQISRKFCGGFTNLNISKIELKTIQNGLINFISKVLKQPENGPILPMGQGLSRNTVESQWKSYGFLSGLMANQNAGNVILNSQNKPQNTNFALISVNQNGEETMDSTMKLGHVNIAEGNGSAINTQKPDAVQKFVLEKIDSIPAGEKEVFDLHIDQVHEYFANGLLVHNCRYAHMAYEDSNFSVSYQ